jgi:hypothetical protein
MRARPEVPSHREHDRTGEEQEQTQHTGERSTPIDPAIAARDSSLDNANCTASRRNSSGYLDGRPIRDSFLWPHARIKCPSKRVNPSRRRARDRQICVPSQSSKVFGSYDQKSARASSSPNG